MWVTNLLKVLISTTDAIFEHTYELRRLGGGPRLRAMKVIEVAFASLRVQHGRILPKPWRNGSTRVAALD